MGIGSMLSFRIDKVLGRGSYALVLHGVETTGGSEVAVKKSRVSTRIKRTLLEHEARVLRIVQGHPSIPTLHAYGRFPHFEYIALELCGSSVRSVADQGSGTSLKTVLIVAKQMISALQHIHSFGIVHRDVKPDNMLVSLQDPSRIMLIDYGISCSRYKGSQPKRYNPEAERRQITGTLTWASLNAHHGLYLSWRDDLESLAYTLLFLLRGGLPWLNLNPQSTIFGKIAQVRMLKTSYNGEQLADGHPAEFGRFLDETRTLSFDEIPPYSQFLGMFDDLYLRSGFDLNDESLDWAPAKRAQPAVSVPMSASVTITPGQIVAVEILKDATILGITPEHELWNVHKSKSIMRCLPAVILDFNNEDGRQHVTLAALRRGPPSLGKMGVIRPTDATPPLLQDDIYCYAYPDTLSCLVSESSTSHESKKYRVQDHVLLDLKCRFIGDTDIKDERDRQVLSTIENHSDNFPILVRLNPLDPNKEGIVDWYNERAWFDEIASIRRKRAVEDGWAWTGTTEDVNDSDDEEELSNSYYGGDLADWDDRQQERDATLTISGLPNLDNLDESRLDTSIPGIKEIIED